MHSLDVYTDTNMREKDDGRVLTGPCTNMRERDDGRVLTGPYIQTLT